MDLKKAERIKELATGNNKHSWRRIAEIIESEFPTYPQCSGNQLWGRELVRMAFKKMTGRSHMELTEEDEKEWNI